MLRKLIKHDLRSLNRYLLVMHGAMLISTFLSWLFTGSFLFFPTGSSIFFLLYTIFLLIIVYATILLIGIHFYKSLFSDEGYLTHTLPVSGSQLLLSKTIAGGIWSGINITLTLFCFCTVLLSAPVLGSSIHMTFTNLLILFLICILQGFTNAIIIYASVSIGQYFPSRPVLAAVVTYLAITIARSIIAEICPVVFGTNPEAVLHTATKGTAAELVTISWDLKSLLLYIILAIATIAILYPVIHHVLKRKINLA